MDLLATSRREPPNLSAVLQRTDVEVAKLVARIGAEFDVVTSCCLVTQLCLAVVADRVFP